MASRENGGSPALSRGDHTAFGTTGLLGRHRDPEALGQLKPRVGAASQRATQRV